MNWTLLRDGRSLFSGAYDACLDHAEEIGACQRTWHFDGTEFAPRFIRGLMLVPAAMVSRTRRRAA